MEVILTGAILSLGYYFNREGLQRDKKYQVTNKVPKIIQPSGKNIYESRRSVDIWEQEQRRADRLFERAKDPANTNVGVAGPPMPRWKKADGDQRNLPLEFDEHAGIEPGTTDDTLPRQFPNNPFENIEEKQSQMNVFDAYPTTGGWNGISLTGEPINERTFKHNNMVPFFGGSVRQNVDDRSPTATALLENFTGNVINYRKKGEVGPIFDPQNNVGNVYGTQNLSDYNRERYVVSNLRNNESPTEKVYIGPGLNQGYTAEPNGGFQQEDSLLYVRPKTVDELRVKTNPKVSYYGRIVAGKKIAKPGKVGLLEKNRPDAFYVNSPDRYFTTTGACIGPTQRPKEILKFVNRSTTLLKNRFGSAGTTTGSVPANRGKVVGPRRSALSNYGFRNLMGTLFGKGEASDYGKKGMMLRPTVKKNTGLTNVRNGNVQPQNIAQPTRNNQKARQTRKTNVVGNGRWAGNVGAVQQQAGVVYDPNQVTRTTVKETTIDNDHFGNLDAINSKTTTRDPTNMIMKPTQKEQFSNISNYGNMEKQNKGTGYQNANYKAPVTHRQTTHTNNYKGNAQGPAEGGYIVKKVQVSVPQRAVLANVEYKGDAYASTEVRPQSYTAVDNMTISSNRETIDQNRIPATQGPKKAITSADIHATTHRQGDLDNSLIEKRGYTGPDRIISDPTTYVPCAETTDKNTLPNLPIQERLDGGILDAFKQNPYTQPLDSFIFA